MGHALTGFMNVTDRLRFVFGPATRLDSDAPVVHKHDEFEQASDEDLSHFVVETDSDRPSLRGAPRRSGQTGLRLKAPRGHPWNRSDRRYRAEVTCRVA